MNKNEVIQKLQATLNTNDQVLTFNNVTWIDSIRNNTLRIVTHVSPKTARAVAEIFCPLDFLIFTNGNGTYITKLCMQERNYIYNVYSSEGCGISKRGNRFNKNSVFVSEKNQKYLLFPSEIYPKYPVPIMEPTACTKQKFVFYFYWNLRRNVFLVALKYKNGAFFHILKWIALFL